MFPLAFVAGWLQGHWWGFISRNYVVWPTFLLMNVFIALKGSHFWFLFCFYMFFYFSGGYLYWHITWLLQESLLQWNRKLDIVNFSVRLEAATKPVNSVTSSTFPFECSLKLFWIVFLQEIKAAKVDLYCLYIGICICYYTVCKEIHA